MEELGSERSLRLEQENTDSTPMACATLGKQRPILFRRNATEIVQWQRHERRGDGTKSHTGAPTDSYTENLGCLVLENRRSKRRQGQQLECESLLF